MTNVIGTHARKRIWNLESGFLGLVGAAMIWQRHLAHNLNVIQETIVLVVFLGGLMGITRIPFPQRLFGRPLPIWAYPAIAGFISGGMDSFLVLLLVGAANLVGPELQQFKFRAYNMIAALIGGLTLYFGEVYMLPLALKYGMRDWYSLLPLVPPIAIFLAILAWLTSRLDVQVLGMQSLDDANGISGKADHGKKKHANVMDYAEFGVAIVLLLVTHNALLCLGFLFLYAAVVGEGEDLIDVMKTETEMGVMLLLVFAAFVAAPIAPYMMQWSGWWAFVPAGINGVLTGAVYPVSGDFWWDALILSTAVLFTPVSSLVGVMLFRSLREWWQFMKISLPLAALWFLLCGAWLYGPWQAIRPYWEETFGAPVLVQPQERGEH